MDRPTVLAVEPEQDAQRHVQVAAVPVVTELVAGVVLENVAHRGFQKSVAGSLIAPPDAPQPSSWKPIGLIVLGPWALRHVSMLYWGLFFAALTACVGVATRVRLPFDRAMRAWLMRLPFPFRVPLPLIWFFVLLIARWWDYYAYYPNKFVFWWHLVWCVPLAWMEFEIGVWKVRRRAACKDHQWRWRPAGFAVDLQCFACGIRGSLSLGRQYRRNSFWFYEPSLRDDDRVVWSRWEDRDAARDVAERPKRLLRWVRKKWRPAP